MIIAKEGTVRIEGDKNEVLAEATVILRNIYCTLVRTHGVEVANEHLTDIAQLAVMSEKEIKELAKDDARVLEN